MRLPPFTVVSPKRWSFFLLAAHFPKKGRYPTPSRQKKYPMVVRSLFRYFGGFSFRLRPCASWRPVGESSYQPWFKRSYWPRFPFILSNRATLLKTSSTVLFQRNFWLLTSLIEIISCIVHNKQLNQLCSKGFLHVTLRKVSWPSIKRSLNTLSNPPKEHTWRAT